MHQVRSCRNRKARLSVWFDTSIYMFVMCSIKSNIVNPFSHVKVAPISFFWLCFRLLPCKKLRQKKKTQTKNLSCFLEEEVKTQYSLVETHELRWQIFIVPAPSSKIGGWLMKQARKYYIPTSPLHILCSHLCSRSSSEALPRREKVHLHKNGSLYQ